VAATIIALENDLFFSVRIRDTLRHHDMNVTIARNLANFEKAVADAAAIARTDETQPALALVDVSLKNVDWEAAIRAARAQDLTVLTFGSHKDLEARARALQAGAHKVLANSKFVKDIPTIVKQALEAPATLSADDGTDDEDEE
jgi:DNA-binding response OmpR family regulator